MPATHIIVIHGLGSVGYEPFAVEVEAAIAKQLVDRLGKIEANEIRIVQANDVCKTCCGGYEPYIEIQTTHAIRVTYKIDQVERLVSEAVYDYGLAVAVVGINRYVERKGGGSKFTCFVQEIERALGAE